MPADTEALLDRLGITITGISHGQSGTEYSARCPYHHDGTKTEHNPSWSINDETGAHLCHSCGFSGGAQWLVHKVAGITYEEAGAWVRTADADNHRFLTNLERIGERFTPEPARPMGRARLLMYDQPPDEALAMRDLKRDSVQAYEVRWETRRGLWVCPIKDPATFALIGLQIKEEGGRYFRNLPPSVPKSSTLFGIELMTGGPVALVESPLDAVRLHGLGIPAVSSYGAQISAAQIDLLVRHADCVIFALDNDTAGIKGMRAAAPRLNRRIRSKRIDYTGLHAKDVGEMNDDQILGRFSDLQGTLFLGTRFE